MEKFLSSVKTASQFDSDECAAFKCFNDIHYNLDLLGNIVKRFAACRDIAILSTLSSDLDSFVCTLKTDLENVLKEIKETESISSKEE